ncbi:helix-turn-helix transcriptional regulator [Exiguobacterium artemiae]
MVGNQVRKYRKMKGLTQKELCQDICSQAEVSKIENLKNIPSAELARNLAIRLDIPIDVLFGN